MLGYNINMPSLRGFNQTKNKIFIAGPTSSGKTSLALRLCEEFDSALLSADSRQIYKDFDVGTGKLPIHSDSIVSKGDDKWKIDGINIWMYDVVDPLATFTVHDFQTRSLEILTQNPKTKFIVGGTGLYLDSLLGIPVSQGSEPNWELRKELEIKTKEDLQGLIPEDVKSEMNYSDINNKRRLIRKIELLNSIDKAENQLLNPADVDSTIIVLNRTRDAIYLRVDRWVESVWEELKKEVIKLIDLGYKDSNVMKGLVYKTALEYVESRNKNERDSIERIQFDLHAYIRRQETWFKKYKQFPNAYFLDPENPGFDLEVRRIVELVC